MTWSSVCSAIVFAPDGARWPKQWAIAAALPMGFQNCPWRRLAPPEWAIHLAWNGDLRLNGAICGRCVQRPLKATTQVPDWRS